MTKNKPEEKLPGLTIPPDLETVYSNVARITHTPSEFIFDFAQMLPGLKTPAFKSRVLLSPLSAKLIYKALGLPLLLKRARILPIILLPIVATAQLEIKSIPWRN